MTYATPSPIARKFLEFSPCLPLGALSATAVICGLLLPAWLAMWTLALAIYVGLKWLSLAGASRVPRTRHWRRWAYLFAWPGMNLDFLDASKLAPVPRPVEWLTSCGKMLAGILLFILAIEFVERWPSQLVAWLAIVGLILALHFGLFALLSAVWRNARVVAEPIMNLPLAARSLSDFWGNRWNRAFRDLAHRFIYRPTVKRLGPAAATVAVFLVSGIVHDAVITLPARGGWGGPTCYFLLQAAGILLERSKLGRHLGLHRGTVTARCFAAAMLVLPLPLLVPSAFLDRVMLPMLIDLKGLI